MKTFIQPYVPPEQNPLKYIYSIPPCPKLRKTPLPDHRMAVPHRATAGPAAAASERRDEKPLIGTSREFHNRPRKQPTTEQKAAHTLQLTLRRTPDSEGLMPTALPAAAGGRESPQGAPQGAPHAPGPALPPCDRAPPRSCGLRATAETERKGLKYKTSAELRKGVGAASISEANSKFYLRGGTI